MTAPSDEWGLPITKAPRFVRMAAAHKIPDLLDAIIARLKETSGDLE